MQDHKEEIISSRVGGLGSSDAKMVARIARNGFISDADKQRIAVMLGLITTPQISSEAIEYGNYIEECLINDAKECSPNEIQDNPMIVNERLTAKFGFKVFSHPDLLSINHKDKVCDLDEIKTTIHSFAETLEEYQEQLYWHWYICKDEFESKGYKLRCSLMHYDATVKEEYDINKLISQGYNPKHSAFDIEKGLQIIADALPTFEYVAPDSIEYEYLPTHVQSRLEEISEILHTIEQNVQKVDEFKEEMYNLMTEHKVKSIKNPYFSLTAIAPTVSKTFDSKKFQKDNKEIYEKYLKDSPKKGYCMLKLKGEK